jgi:hypothetical protein
MKLNLWTRLISQGKIPGYPCPACADGKLKILGDLEIEEPKFSSNEHSHDAWEPDWIISRFHAKLVCDENDCGEIVHIGGDGQAIEELDEEYGWGIVQMLRPQFMFPAPPMIAISDSVPDKVSEEIRKSFAVSWFDPNAAANRLRVSVERIMDDLGAPTEGKTKAGKSFDLDLNGRIQWLEKSSGAKKDHAETFQTLRRIGNMGSHGSSLSWDDFLAALTIYESALDDLYGEKSALVAKAKAHLLALTAKKVQSAKKP